MGQKTCSETIDEKDMKTGRERSWQHAHIWPIYITYITIILLNPLEPLWVPPMPMEMLTEDQEAYDI